MWLICNGPVVHCGPSIVAKLPFYVIKLPKFVDLGRCFDKNSGNEVVWWLKHLNKTEGWRKIFGGCY